MTSNGITPPKMDGGNLSHEPTPEMPTPVVTSGHITTDEGPKRPENHGSATTPLKISC